MNQMTDRAVRLLALAATVVVIVGSVAYANASGAGVVAIASMLLVAGSFLITGFVAWAHRPANRMGRLMVALALCLLLTAFAQPVWPVVVPFGLLVFALSNSLLGYLILAYPSGELRSNANRALVALTFVFGGGPRFVRLLTQDPRASGLGFDNPYLVFHDPTFASTMARLPYYLDIVLLVVFVIFVVARWIGASGPARRSLSPAMVPTVALLMVLIGDAITIVIDVPADVRAFFDNAQLLARIAIPIGFLAGLLRMQIARSAIADLVVELGGMPSPARLQVALAHALGDPTLMVVYPTPRPDVFVDAAGANVNVPEEGSGRVVTMLGHDGKTLAALIHDEGLPVDPGLVAGVASALRLAVDNDRLQTQVESQLDEVRASRARIVAAGDAERKRVERDLHDGAQQRLVSLTLALRLARAKIGDSGDEAVRLSLEQASEEAKAALSELRELARGIHPQILTEAGLAAAIESLANRSPVDVAVNVGPGRYPSAVEGAAYFAVSEALANVAKYAQASHVLVQAQWADGALSIEVSDDGVGGADPSSGSGLRGLADRLAAIDGTIDVVSPSGGGTRFIARIPTGAPVATAV